jgi:hypothetical protein
MGERAWPVIVAGLVVMLLMVALVPDDPEPSVGASTTTTTVAAGGSDGAGADFLAAYRRSRTATFAVDQRITRSIDGRDDVTSTGRLVQRPPDDRLVVGLGGADGRRGGHVLRCPTGPDGTAGACTEGPPAAPYDDEVAAEVDTLGRLLEGTYRLAVDDDGCFALRLVPGAVPSPTYGEAASFCFDAATGAPTRVEVRQPGATTTIEATHVTPHVTDADLRIG